jgi:hypothetical protein
MDGIGKRRLIWPGLALLLAATSGCLAPPIHPAVEPSPPLVLPGPPITLPSPDEVALQLPDSEPVTWRAVSSEPEASKDLASYPLPGTAPLPGALEVCSLNSVFQLAKGDGSPQTRDDALKTLSLFGLTGMVQLLRHTGGPSGDHLHRMGDFTDDLLQPDDESAATKRVRPPFTFGLEWRY